jgi:hypothetical protein
MATVLRQYRKRIVKLRAFWAEVEDRAKMKESPDDKMGFKSGFMPLSPIRPKTSGSDRSAFSGSRR